MKILSIGDASSVFFYETVRRLLKARPDFDIDVLDLRGKGKKNCGSAGYYSIGSSFLLKIPLLRGFSLAVLVRRAVRQLPGKYDCVQVHYVMPCLGLAAGALRRKGRMIASFWGSDLFCGGRIDRLLQKRILNSSWRITLYTPQMKQFFTEKFGKEYNKIIRDAGFGTNALDEIDALRVSEGSAGAKEKLMIPPGRLLAVCGGNGYESQQHETILCALRKLSRQTQGRFYFIFQMSYGGSEPYKEHIKSLFGQSGLEGRVITDYTDWVSVARLRLAADVFIFLQKADGFSSALREHLYAGGVPVIGSWLRYEALEKKAFYHTAAGSDELASVLSEIAENVQEEQRRCQINRKIVAGRYSWQNAIEKWAALFDEQQENT